MDGLEILVLSLATWRIAALLVLEDGPFGVFARFRRTIGVEMDRDGNPVAMNEAAALFSCVWCASVYIALGLFLLWLWKPEITMLASAPLAISTGAIVIQEIANGDS